VRSSGEGDQQRAWCNLRWRKEGAAAILEFSRLLKKRAGNGPERELRLQEGRKRLTAFKKKSL